MEIKMPDYCQPDDGYNMHYENDRPRVPWRGWGPQEQKRHLWKKLGLIYTWLQERKREP